MNTLIVNRQHTIRVPGYPDTLLKVGDKISSDSPFYYPLLWSGYGTDSGAESGVENKPIDAPSAVIVSATNPNPGPGVMWLQLLPNGNYSLWYEDGKNA